MAAKKIIDVTGSSKKVSKKKLDLSKLNIDFDEIVKFAKSLLDMLKSNPTLIKKIISNPSSVIKKLVKSVDFSKDTKSAFINILKSNKKSDLSTILDKISNSTDKDASSLFEPIKKITDFADDLNADSIMDSASKLLGGKNKKGFLSSLGKLFKK